MRPKGTSEQLAAVRNRGLSMLEAGKTPKEVAEILKVTPRCVNRWQQEAQVPKRKRRRVRQVDRRNCRSNSSNVWNKLCMAVVWPGLIKDFHFSKSVSTRNLMRMRAGVPSLFAESETTCLLQLGISLIEWFRKYPYNDTHSRFVLYGFLPVGISIFIPDLKRSGYEIEHSLKKISGKA